MDVRPSSMGSNLSINLINPKAYCQPLECAKMLWGSAVQDIRDPAGMWVGG